ncbi:protein FAM228B-like [Hydractinia symbiolongicarpus]|uniref:protein FAM228B-like n=1 Tax=Hydractinia symbiolongicarpus TaxID=13093 RepID=UPI0025508311|nr:protein FAM228B-like [Hydractinia symbiolongicarpus]
MKKQRPKTTGSIKVFMREVNQDLLKHGLQQSRDNASMPQKSLSSRTVYMSRSPSASISGWLSEKSIKTVQEKTDYESSAIKNMYLNLLENEQKIQRHLDYVIEHDSMVRKRRLQALLKEWYEQTYNPLNEKILEEMNGESYKTLEKTKREEYNKYLKHRNEKGHVFLDVFEKEEYDPLSVNSERPGPIKAVTHKLADPLLQQQQERNEEERVVLACDLGTRLSDKRIEMLRLPPLPLVPLGRHGTECKTWLDMKLTDIQSGVRQRSQERFYGVRNMTSACPYEVIHPDTDLEIFDKKNHWKKKRQFPEKYDTSIKLV